MAARKVTDIEKNIQVVTKIMLRRCETHSQCVSLLKTLILDNNNDLKIWIIITILILDEFVNIS